MSRRPIPALTSACATNALIAGGIALAIALALAMLSGLTGLEVFALPFIASAAVVAMAPAAPLAQPTSIVLGYGSAGVIAVMITAVAGPATVTATLAAGTSITVMLLLKAPHAPAVAAAAFIGKDAPGADYLVTAIAPAVVTVTLAALLAGRLLPGYRYPAQSLIPIWRRRGDRSGGGVDGPPGVRSGRG